MSSRSASLRDEVRLLGQLEALDTSISDEDDSDDEAERRRQEQQWYEERKEYRQSNGNKTNIHVLIAEWYAKPENIAPIHWKETSFGKTKGGKLVRRGMLDFVWDNLIEAEKAQFLGGRKCPQFNDRVSGVCKQIRKKTVEENFRSVPVGTESITTGKRMSEKGKKERTKEGSDFKEIQKRYNKTPRGITLSKNRAAKHRKTEKGKKTHKKLKAKWLAKLREIKFKKRAAQTFAILGHGRTAGEVGRILVTKPRLKLFGMSTLQYQEHVGPGQYFFTAQDTDYKIEEEAFALWTEPGRNYPAIMKNPAKHKVQDRLVQPDEVEDLGLVRFKKTELIKMGWKYITLMEFKMNVGETNRPAFAVEQQTRVLSHHLCLGPQRNNRTPGAASTWDVKVTDKNCYSIVGFAYAPPFWLEKYWDKIAFVDGKHHLSQPKIAKMMLDGENETMGSTSGHY